MNQSKTPYLFQLTELSKLLNFSLPEEAFDTLRLKFTGRQSFLRSINNGNGILLECHLMVPDGVESRIRNKEAMLTHYCFVESAGSTLALDVENNLVLQKQVSLDKLSTKDFQNILEDFLNTANRLDASFKALVPSEGTDITQFKFRI